MNRRFNQRGFTLIELMTVMVIISILASIAVPNFMNAKVRAQVARSGAEQELLSWALESYFVDRDGYPPNRTISQATFPDLIPLTTPIPYLSNIPDDVFLFPPTADRNQYIESMRNGNRSYFYTNLVQANGKRTSLVPYGLSGTANFNVAGMGPSYEGEIDVTKAETFMLYSPSNGLNSYGVITTFGP